MTRTPILATLCLLWAAGAFPAVAQTNVPPKPPIQLTNSLRGLELREQCRARCIAERRSICGKILRVFPKGVLVDSGYTNLIREPLTRSWLVPGTAAASRAPNAIETKEPGAICVGIVFITDLPRGQPRENDYVILGGYPAGEFTYTSVGTLQKTVRRFSANLDKAVQANLTPPQASRAEPH